MFRKKVQNLTVFERQAKALEVFTSTKEELEQIDTEIAHEMMLLGHRMEQLEEQLVSLSTLRGNNKKTLGNIQKILGDDDDTL